MPLYFVVVVAACYSYCGAQYACISGDMEWLAVAGVHGVAYYSMLKRKWTLFGNQAQEHEFSCHGGLLWWGGFLAVACQTSGKNNEVFANLVSWLFTTRRRVSIVHCSALAASLRGSSGKQTRCVADSTDAIGTTAECARRPPAGPHCGQVRYVERGLLACKFTWLIQANHVAGS